MDKAKTIEIPVILQEAVDTGYITQESLDALEFEKLKAKEEIENLRKLYREQLISHEQLEAGMRGIKQKMHDKILALKFDNT